MRCPDVTVKGRWYVSLCYQSWDTTSHPEGNNRWVQKPFSSKNCLQQQRKCYDTLHPDMSSWETDEISKKTVFHKSEMCQLPKALCKIPQEILRGDCSWIWTYQYTRIKTPSGSFESVWAAFQPGSWAIPVLCSLFNSQLSTPSTCLALCALISPGAANAWVRHTSRHTTGHRQSLICALRTGHNSESNINQQRTRLKTQIGSHSFI